MREENKQICHTKWVIRFLAMFPVLMTILEPYAFTDGGGLLICDVLVILLAICLVVSRTIQFHKGLFTLLIIDFLLTIISFLLTNSNQTNIFLALKVFVTFTLYLMAYSSIWSYDIKETFLKVAEIAGLVCAILAILQFCFASLGFEFYDGKLFFPLSEGSYFGGLHDRNTQDLRVHSFFEEPSYLGIFELPVTVYLFQYKKFIKAIICAISCIASGSMIGVIGLIICVIALLLADNDIQKNTKLKIVIILILGILGLIYVYNSNVSFRNLIDYYIERISTIQLSSQRADSSFSQRIIGNVGLFQEYKPINKIIGVGFNQYSLYFGIYKDYSNDFVSNLLNFGYIGILCMIITIWMMLKNVSPHGRIFLLILVLVLAVDHSWFSALFFYLFSWVVINTDKRKENRLFVKVRYWK